MGDGMGSMSPPRKVLLVTNSEHGQANVYLAVSYALLTLPDEDVEVHFASFAPAEKNVALITQFAREAKPTARPIVFHTIDGPSMQEAWSRPEIAAERAALNDETNFVHAIRRTWLLLRITMPWSGSEFLQVFRSVTDIVQTVQPHVTAVDPAFAPGLTALSSLKIKFVILSPNTIKDFAMALQPNGEPLWKYPWYPHHPQAFLVANKKELEFPLQVIPPHIIQCGPMIRPARPVDEVDPDLAKWLTKGPTVYINLGTHAIFSEAFALEMAKSIRMLLDQASASLWLNKGLANLQVLWKLKTDGKYEVGVPGSRIYDIIGRELDAGIVRVVSWIKPEPTALFEKGTIVCAVHHGGANSFLEVASAGVPMVVLPAWMDCYDFARRAEVLGIGRWGNRTALQECRAEELGPILAEILVGGRYSRYASRAKELADVCKKDGGGRLVAARYILGEISKDIEEEGPSFPIVARQGT
ncbi:glycosyltransferase family 1 protein [Thozetella sp. PMI_491]|nr:glycosyltransferase family 1 protein [Thozetella sp. PMI_491]